jgi:hypothetical protein
MNLYPITRKLPAAVASLLVLALSSCTTSPPDKTARPGSGLAEYLDLVQHSRQAVDSALTALDTLNNQGSTASPTAVSAFSEEVDRLEAASVQVRARAQAMQARGDAYFQNWEENVAAIPDAGVRALAKRNRNELEHSFASIKVMLAQTRTVFQSFLGNLRKLRTTTEKDPTAFAVAPAQDLVRNAREQGRLVEGDLDAVALELRHMMALLLPPDRITRE